MVSRSDPPRLRLLVNAIDEKAERNPDGPYIWYAKTSNWEQEGGYHTITWKQFANSINKAAFWLDEQLSRMQHIQTISYVGPNDPRYYILVAAAAKSQRRLFIPDGRITQEGSVVILNEIQCDTWITTQDQVDNAQDLLAKIPSLKLLIIPPLEYFIHDSSATPPYQYDQTWEQAKDEIICIIHTSGTTGHPKPIYLRNGFMSAWDGWNTIFERHRPRTIAYERMVGAHTLTTCAPQWAAGIGFSLLTPAFLGMTTVMLPPDMTSPLDRQEITKIAKHTGVQSIVTPPSLIEDFHHDEAAFNFLKSLDFVCYVGAALDHGVGDALAEHTFLFPAIGSTERGAQVSFASAESTTWMSFDFVPEMGTRLELVSDDLYELYIDRTSESDFFQCGFYTFPNIDSIAAEELYSPLIDKYGTKRWVSRGRKDDLVKLSWLAKFHATHIEDAIIRHPRVRSVFVGGEGRDVPFIIIEPQGDEVISSAEQDKLVDEIYNQVIYNVNEQDADDIRIPREMVMLTDPSLPLKRTIKMTIMRKEVEKQYKDHIEALYLRWEGSKTDGVVA